MSDELTAADNRSAVHWAAPGSGDAGTSCLSAPAVEYDPADSQVITWNPTITNEPGLVTCERCYARITSVEPDTHLGLRHPPLRPRARGGVIRPGQQIFISGQDGPITPLRPALPAPKWHTGPMPIDHVVINGTQIDGTQFEMGSLQHDVNSGTVTITFCNVGDLVIVYKHMLGEEQR